MATTVNVHEAKTHLSRFLELAHQGEEIVIAKAGRPYARLVPLAVEETTRAPGGLDGVVGDEFFAPLPDDELDAWEGR